MPTRFFDIPSKEMKHHSVSLLPDVERIIRVTEAQVLETIPSDKGEIANFSTTINLMILTRFATLRTTMRKNQKPDPDAIQYVIDLINHKRTITDLDLEDYKKALASITKLYQKTT
jgi:hypothetical protein